MLTPILLPAHNPGPMTGSGNNTYLLIAPSGGATLIDAGVGDPRHLAALAHHLSERGATLDQVLVTHGHPDHASGAVALARAHPAARFRKHPWPDVDARYDVQWQPLTDGDRLTIGTEVMTMMDTPGHSPDHMAFWHESSGTAFTGDLVVLGGTVMIHASGGGDLRAYLQSLERIRSLQPHRLLPAHGPEIADPQALLAAYVGHRLAREQQVAAALASGCETIESIVESIYHGLDPMLVPAARETVRAHLDKLRTDGRAFEENDRWKA